MLTPIAKFWDCKRGAALAQEATECLVGNGYAEEHGEGVMVRIYREMRLNSIWEGTGNIMALDLLRALRTGPVADALAHQMAPAKGAHPALDRQHAPPDGGRQSGGPESADEVVIRPRTSAPACCKCISPASASRSAKRQSHDGLRGPQSRAGHPNAGGLARHLSPPRQQG